MKKVGWHAGMSKDTNADPDVAKLEGEISQSSGEILSLLNMCLTLTVVILGIALTAKNGYVLIASFVVIIPTSMLVLERLKALWRSAAYLNVFGSGAGSEWECRVDKMRKIEKDMGLRLPVPKYVYAFGYIFSLIGSGYTCAVVAWVLLWEEAFYVGLAIFGIWALISIPISCWAWCLREGGTVYEKYVEQWNEIKQSV
jgi:hypothetical protein